MNKSFMQDPFEWLLRFFIITFSTVCAIVVLLGLIAAVITLFFQ